MTSGKPKITLYKQAKKGLKSLFVQTAQVSAGLIVMLIVTGGNPPGWLVSTSFLFGVGFVAWSENKRQINLFKHKTPSIPTEANISHTISPSTDNHNIQTEMDAQHLKILQKGVEVWNKWRKDNFYIQPDLSHADLSNANLNLKGVKLNNTNLSNTNLSSVFIGDADLSGANFNNANLSNANLTNANLSYADLRGANLTKVQALATNFEGATLTDACIQDWNINSKTNLKDVNCDYIYLKVIYSEQRGKEFSDRRPHDPDKIFAPGEFTQLFQKALETVDLIFSEGIEWTAFLESFQQLQAEVKSEELSIQAIEKKSGGAFVIRLEVPKEANKAEIEKCIKQEYNAKLKVIEASYQKQLQAKDEIIQAKSEELIKAYREEKSQLIEVVKTMSNINPIINIINDNNSNMTSGNTYNQSGNIGIGHNEGDISGGAIAGVYNQATQQDLKQAAAEIQQSLDQLQQTNNFALEVAQQQTAKDLATKAQNDPSLKNRLIQLGKFISENSAKTVVSEGVKGVIKLFLLMV